MTTATMSPNIKKLLDEILISFSLGEPRHHRRTGSMLSANRDDRGIASTKETKSPPSKAFVNSVRKRAKAS
jgi:hypothetical protein